MKPDPNNEARTASRADVRALLEEHRSSDLSIAAFARAKGVKPWALYNARSVERRRAVSERSTGFTEVRVVGGRPAPAAKEQAIELALPSGVVLRVRRDFDEVALRRLIGVLGSC